MFNKLAITLAGILSTSLTPAAHAIEMGQLKMLVQQAKTDQGVADVLDMYLAGLMEGVTVANTMSPTPSFCPPGTLTLTKENARDFILKSRAAKLPNFDKYVASLVLMKELQIAFPCK